MSPHTIRLFGAPAFIIAGEDRLAELPLKGLALIGYLAMEGGAHRRDALAALLWPDTEESRRRGNLRTLLYDLNKLAPELLAVDRQTVRLAGDGYQVDAAEARRLLAEDSPEARLKAAALLRGPFLQDLALEDADTYERWLSGARGFWENAGPALLQAAAETQLMGGKPADARALYEGLLRFQPWHEPSQRALMRLDAAGGDYARALQRDARLAEILESELGVEPEAETTALRDRITQARTRPPHPFPAQPTAFIGRGAETAQLRAILAGREQRLISLLGPGGIGKTRLALHLAAGSGYLFLDGVVFIPLAGLRPEEPIYTAIAQALEVPGIRAGDVGPALFSFLKDRELLLILDNFEHLTGQAERLSELLAECPGVQLLLTSRTPAGIRWESVFRLDGLPVPPEDDPAPEGYPAVQLFSAAARRADAAFDPGPHGQAAGRVCRAVAGAPLALELAGALAASESPERVAARIEASLAGLETSLVDVPERQRSLGAVFDYSWGLLSGEEQDQLGKLSVFRGGFTRAAARAVSGCPRRVLDGLAAKSLLAVRGDRFDFHPLVGEFAAERVSPEDAAQTAAAHAAYYAAAMDGIVSQMVGLSQMEMVRRARADYGNFAAAFDWGLAHDPAGLAPLVEGLTRYFDLTSLFRDGLGLMKRAEAQLAGSDDPILGDIRVSLARFENKQIHYADAIALARGVAEDTALRDRVRAAAYLEWGWALWHIGEIKEAAAPLAAGRELALAVEDGFLLAHLLRNQGIVAWHESKFEEARVYTEDAHDTHKEIGDLQGMADALNNLALVSGDQGDYGASMAYLKEALAIKRELGDVNGEAVALGNLGTLYAFLGMFSEAEAALAEGISLSTEVGNYENTGHSVTNRAGLYDLMGRFEEALVESERSLKLSLVTGDTVTEAYAHEYRGLALGGLGDLAAGEAAFRESLDRRRGFGLDEFVYLSLARLAWNLAQQERGEEALALVAEMEALDEKGAVQNVRIAQSGCWNTYRVLTKVGDQRAGAYLKKAAAHVMSQAEGIMDKALRKSFLENVPEQRAILAKVAET